MQKLSDTAVVTLDHKGSCSRWNISAKQLAKSGWVQASSDEYAPVRLAVERLVRKRFSYRGRQITVEIDTGSVNRWAAYWVYGFEQWMDGTFSMEDGALCVASALTMCDS